MSKIKDFDVEKVYDEQIAPLMSQIINICQENKIPLLCTFAYKFEADPEDDPGAERLSLCTTYVNNFKGREIPEMKRAAECLRRTFNSMLAFTITKDTDHGN